MKSLGRQALAILVSGTLAALPLFAASPRGLIGMAQGAGSIEINGAPFGGRANLFSGDSVETGAKAPLTVVTSAAERFRIEPNSSAEVAKVQQDNLIRLENGSVEFDTAGATSASLPGGLAVHPVASKPTVALVHRLANGDAEVTVYKGSVEVAALNAKAMIPAGHSALVRALSTSSNAQNSNANNNHHKRKAWAIFIVTGANAAAVAAVLANEQSTPVSIVDP